MQKKCQGQGLQEGFDVVQSGQSCLQNSARCAACGQTAPVRLASLSAVAPHSDPASDP
jgi:hypothetical protein